MPQDDENLNDIVKISPLQSILKKNSNSLVNKNYREFQAVYGKNYEGCEKKTTEWQWRNSDVRPKTKLKAITMDMPGIGLERAILQPWKTSALKSVNLKQKKVVIEKEVAPPPNPHIAQENSELKEELEKKPLLELHKMSSTFLEQTNIELNIAVEQLNHIKRLIKMKEIVMPKKIKSPKTKSRRNSHYHKECLRKNYISTLSTVQQKLQRLEDKYFTRPKIIYRNVNDSFTQFSEVETLYESYNHKDENSNQKLEVIIQDLEKLINKDENDTPRNYPPRDFSLTLPVNSDAAKLKDVKLNADDHNVSEKLQVEEEYKHNTVSETRQMDSKLENIDYGMKNTNDKEKKIEENIWYFNNRLSFKKPESSVPKDALSRLIDVSESRLRNFRRTKQDIVDVEAICDKICDLSKEDESINIGKESLLETNSFFDGTELQQNVSKSCYLTKEFGTVNVFIEKKPSPIEFGNFRSVTNLIRNLTSTLEYSMNEVDVSL